MRIKRPGFGVVAITVSLIVVACTSGTTATTAPSVAAPGSAAPSGAASPSGSAAGEQYTIGFVVPLISNPYWKLMQDFAQGAAGTLGIDLQTAQADSDESKQIAIVEGMISAGVDGIVIGVVSDKVGATVLESAEAAGIPVTFMQRSPGVAPDAYQGKSYIGYVGTDDIGGGETASQTLYDSGARKWVAMTGSQGNSVAEDRLKAAQDFAAAHPDVTILQSQYGNEARDAGQKTMENFLSAYPGPGFDGVYSFNDEGALGAVQALKNANALASVKVTRDRRHDRRDQRGGGGRAAHERRRWLCLRSIRPRRAVRSPQRSSAEESVSQYPLAVGNGGERTGVSGSGPEWHGLV